MEELPWADNNNVGALRVVLVIVGIIFIFGIYPLSIVWPAGWTWHASGRSIYLEMILGVYRDARCFAAAGLTASAEKLEPIWVHCVVECGAWRHHGRAGAAVSGSIAGICWATCRRCCLVALALAVLTVRAKKGAPQEAF